MTVDEMLEAVKAARKAYESPHSKWYDGHPYCKELLGVCLTFIDHLLAEVWEEHGPQQRGGLPLVKCWDSWPSFRILPDACPLCRHYYETVVRK